MKKWTLKIILLFGLLLCGLVFWQTIFRDVNVTVTLSNDRKVFILLFGVVLLFFLYKQCDNILSKCSEKSIQRVKRFLAVMAFGVQLLVLYVVITKKAYPNTDLAVATDSAIKMLEGYYFPLNSNILRYTQNRCFILILYYFYKILNGLGISNFWEMSIVLNFIAIDVAAYLTYACLKDITKKEKDLFWLTCTLVFNPFMYLWFPYYYTSILSLPFMMAAIYCLQVFISKKREKVLLIIGGGMAAIAFKIRVVTFIPIIAFFIFGILNIKFNVWKLFWKVYLKRAVLFIIVFLLSAVFLQKAVNMHAANLSENNEFPSTHYIMMGLQGDGRYSSEDMKYTESYDTKEKKIEANIEEIEKRIKNLGIFGLTDLYERKISITWADGYDGYTDWYSLKYPILAGTYKDFLIYYCQIYRAFSFLFILIYCGYALKRKEETNKFLIYELTLIGAIVFYALWEANAKYSVGFSFIVTLLMAAGMTVVPSSKNLKINKQFGITALLFAFFQIFVVTYNYVSANRAEEEYILCQNYRNAYINIASKNADRITQSFSVKKSFNRILIGIKSNGVEQEDGYVFTLRDKNQILYTTQFGGEETKYQSNFIVFDLGKVIEADGREMWIEIQDMYQDVIGLEFAIENSKLDYAPDSYLWFEGEQEDSDLTFIVSMYSQIGE